jgi:Mn2+/Fe2+ NRAMP family transporter
MLTSASRNAAKLGLIVLMILGALMMWVGSPALWLWIGSQMTESQQGEFGPYVLVAVGILGSTVAVAIFLARISRVYERVTGTEATVRVRLPWLRSLRDERSQTPQVTVLDLILVATALLAITTFGVWFLLFAGSPLPG